MENVICDEYGILTVNIYDFLLDSQLLEKL